MLAQLRPALVLIVILTILTGLAYPLAITGVSQLAFANNANGSPVTRDGVLIGSALIGQNFATDEYFWSRPSATGPDPYNAGASSGSNYGPTSAAMIERTTATVSTLGSDAPVPGDAATASGSGLDPHISPEYAALQVERVAAARGLEPSAVSGLVASGTEQPLLGIFGEPRVDLLALNLALDALPTN